MSEEITEETNVNPEETTPEETPKENLEEIKVEKETPKEKPKESYTDREKRYYARMKESEEIAKTAKAELTKAKEEVAKAKLPISDIDAILEVNRSTNGLDPEEITELRLRATALGTSLSEARNDKNYQLWQKSYREAVEKEKALNPSTRQPEVQKEKPLEEKFEEMKGGNPFAVTPEMEQLAEKEGLWISPKKRKDVIPLSRG